jgi:hypothetical protein
VSELTVYILGDVNIGLIVDIFANAESAERERINLEKAYRANGITLTVTPWEVVQ